MTASLAATSAAGETAAERCREDASGGGLLSELLVASGRHDEVAFTRLYQLTSPWMHHLLRRRTTSTADTENAIRLTYTTIWHRAASYAPPNQSALAWMTNLAYDVVESGKPSGR
jgi:DNA-directed RNA polymerase specialized sigma24 family protein